MKKPVFRPYKDAHDLKTMQKLTQAIWSLEANYHIGDLAWQRYRHAGRENEWHTAIWEVEGTPVAWGWIKLPDSLMLQVDPNFPEIANVVLDWYDHTTETKDQIVTVLETESHIISALENSSFTSFEATPEVLSKISLEHCPFPVTLPENFTARHLRGVEDLPKRVAVQRAAFESSRVTEESYLNVMQAEPYDQSLDWVIESPTGEFVAFCLIWFDDVNKVGLLEPVGTDPKYWRMGLGSSICKLALNALREKGAETATVVSTSPETYKFYKSIGFEQYAQTKSFRRFKKEGG